MSLSKKQVLEILSTSEQELQEKICLRSGGPANLLDNFLTRKKKNQVKAAIKADSLDIIGIPWNQVIQD